MKDETREVLITINDGSVYSGTWKVRNLPSSNLIAMQKRMNAKYRKATDEERNFYLLEKIIKFRLVGWDLECGKQFSEDAVDALIANKLEFLNELLREADEKLEQDFDASWGN